MTITLTDDDMKQIEELHTLQLKEYSLLMVASNIDPESFLKVTNINMIANTFYKYLKQGEQKQ